MISRYTIDEFKNAVARLGLPANANVLTSVSFFKLGMLQGRYSRDEYMSVLCTALLDVLGPKATLVANAFSSYVGRFGHDFVWEKTETTTGQFTEWLLALPHRNRSLHPTHSVAAIGPNADFICENVRPINYGLGTPYDRMLQLENTYVMRLGIEPYFNAFTHHAEAVANVCYLYHKMLDVRVMKHGQEIPGPWFSYVRYLHFPVNYGFDKLEKAVDEAGLIRREKVGAGEVCILNARDYYDLMIKSIIKDPYFLLEGAPDVPKGQIPRDGLSAVRDGVHFDRTDY